jgi:hypothetical protein
MSSGATTIAAALIGSAPGWVGIHIANRRALNRQTEQFRQATAAQTEELKAHIGPAATARDGGAR